MTVSQEVTPKLKRRPPMGYVKNSTYRETEEDRQIRLDLRLPGETLIAAQKRVNREAHARLTLAPLRSEALASRETSPLELTPERGALLIPDPWEALDPNLKEGQQKASFEKFLAGRPVENLDQLERIEDEVVENVYHNAKNEAEVKASTKSGTNHTRYKIELGDLQKKKAQEDQAREAFRRRRRAQLVALLAPALLRQPGNPRDQHQHAEQLWREATGDKAKRSHQGAPLLGSASQSAFSTTGPTTRADVRDAKKALKKPDDSS